MKIIYFLLLSVGIFCAIFYGIFFSDIPSMDIDKIYSIPQATVLTDRNGTELFRFFEENRRRTPYEKISPHIINALVATEDKTFRDNKGYNYKSIIRSAINNFLLRAGNTEIPFQGGSTITQQLVKNIFLYNKKTIKRKLQEIVLSQLLTKKLSTKIRKRHTQRDEKKVHRKTKEKIIEGYMNYVFFGNQSYGINAAAKNYFNKTPDKLNVLESSILASLPQAPSLYNPLLNKSNVMGSRYIDNGNMITPVKSHETKSYSGTLFSGLQTKVFPTFQEETKCLPNLIKRASVKRSGSGTNYNAIYYPGRKDIILCKMFARDSISRQEFKNAFLATKNIAFRQIHYPIKAPHFVFYAKSYLLQLPYFKERGFTEADLSHAGLTIKTSLDLNRQKMAQDAFDNFKGQLHKLGGDNRSLIHIDSKNGDILSYLGSLDFYDETIQGQYDIIQAKKQVGSTLKPLFYAYLFKYFHFRIQDIIQDRSLFFLGKKGPKNHDKNAWGSVTMALALASSRNLPVVRLFYGLGKEKVLVPFLRSLGLKSLQDNVPYGYPLVLGAAEISTLELAQSYMQLSNINNKIPKINPIISVTDRGGKLIYTKELERKEKKVIPPAVSYMIWNILKEKKYRPRRRRGVLSIDGLKNYAIKTGTSDKKIHKEVLPRDAWMVLYTLEDIIITRAGKTDGGAMTKDGYGSMTHHRVMNDYLSSLQGSGLIIDKNIDPPGGYASGYYIKANKTLSPRSKKMIQGF